MSPTPSPCPAAPRPTAPRPTDPRRPSTSDDVEARLTFLKFQCRPLVTIERDPGLYRAILLYAKHIDSFCKRLDYRRSHLGTTLRLVRNPILGTVSAPPRPLDAPGRRVLTLTALLAAACEEVEGGVTLVKLSDLVAELAAAGERNLRPYDPDLMKERRELSKAADLLEYWGVLRRRTTLMADVTEWTERRSGIGAGYDIDREALLLFVTPDTIALAAHQQEQLAEIHRPVATSPRSAGDTPGGPRNDSDDEAAEAWSAQQQATRVVRHLRALVETPALLYADLPADEVELARTQRGLRAEAAINLIGGTVEARSEGLVWVSQEEECPATAVWPTSSTESWAALMAADMAGRAGDRDLNGVVHLDADAVDAVLDDLTGWKGHLYRKDLQNNPVGLRNAVEVTLRWVGLLRTGPDGSWALSPLAGRYRDPELVQPDPTPADDQQLFVDDPDDPARLDEELS